MAIAQIAPAQDPSLAEGKVLKVGERALFFEGLTEQDTTHVYNSIVYGGFAPVILSNLLDLGGNRADHAGLPDLGLMLRIFGGLSYLLHFNYGMNNMVQILKAGFWYYLPHLTYMLKHNPNPTLCFYSGAALLHTLETLRGLFTQSISTSNTQYVHIPLGGSASRKFFIRALFQNDPVYTLSHVGQNETNNEGDVFSHLSRVLSACDVDFLTIRPLRDQGSSIVQVIFYTPGHDEETIIYIKGWPDEHDNSEWLLHSIHQKRDRSRLTTARFALSPSLLSATASAMEMFFTEEKQTTQGALDKIAKEQYQFIPSDSSVTGQVNDIEHRGSSSEFIMGNKELVYQWGDGYLWPRLSLVPALPSNQELTQWWIPEWLGRFLVAELASRGRQLAYSATANVADRLMPHLLISPVRRLRFSLDTDNPRVWQEPVIINDSVRFKLDLMANQLDPDNLDRCSYCYGEINDVGFYKTSCCQQIYLCPECQQTWSRQQYNVGKFVWDAGVLPPDASDTDVGIQLNCMVPTCKGKIPAVIGRNQ